MGRSDTLGSPIVNDDIRGFPDLEGYTFTPIENGVIIAKDRVRGINVLFIAAGFGILVVFIGLSAAVVYRAAQSGLSLGTLLVATFFSLPGLLSIFGIRALHRLLVSWRATLVADGAELYCCISIGKLRRRLVFHYPLHLILRRSFNRGDWGFTIFLQDTSMRRMLLVIPTMVASNERRAWLVGNQFAKWLASRIRADIISERWSSK